MGTRTLLLSVAGAALALAMGGCGPAPEPAGVVPTPVTPTAEPSTTPPTGARSGRPPLPAALLEAEDFGQAYVPSGPVLSEIGPIPSLRVLDPMECPAWQPAPGGGSAALVLDQVRQLYAAPQGHFDAMAVWRFRAAGASAAMAEVREQLRLCAREELVGIDVSVVVAWTVLAAGVAGQESLVVRLETRRNNKLSNVDFFVVVRQGPIVGRVWLRDQRWTLDQLRAFGVRMAARLCAVTAC